MKNFIDLKVFAISLIICGLVAIGVSYFFGISFFTTFLIIVVALLVNGIVAAWEDELPGGFNNPTTEKQDIDES